MNLKNVISLLVSFFALPACASMPAQNEPARFAASHEILNQYFSGNIQRTSLDGHTPYGPSFRSLVHRMVAPAGDKIIECVIQEEKVFVTEMTRTSEPLVFNAIDTAGSFTGKLVYEDETLLAWSYDIQVVKPHVSKILGSLADGNGARIDSKTGEMQITKIWHNQVRIREAYESISRGEYSKMFDDVTLGQASPDVIQTCRN